MGARTVSPTSHSPAPSSTSPARSGAQSPQYNSAAATREKPAPSSKSATAGSSSAVSSNNSSGAATKTAPDVASRTEFDESSKVGSEASVASPALYSEKETAATAHMAESRPDASQIEQIKSSLEKRRKMFLVTALEGAREAAIEGDELCMEFAPDARHLRDTLSKSENVKILREVCREITGRDLGVRFVVRDEAAGDAPVSKEETERREKQDLRETVEKDPVVQQMLRTFRGEIVDVKRVDGEG